MINILINILLVIVLAKIRNKLNNTSTIYGQQKEYRDAIASKLNLISTKFQHTKTRTSM